MALVVIASYVVAVHITLVTIPACLIVSSITAYKCWKEYGY